MRGVTPNTRRHKLHLLLVLMTGVCTLGVGLVYGFARSPRTETGTIGRAYRLAPLAPYREVVWLSGDEIALLADGSVSSGTANGFTVFLFDRHTANEDVWFVARNRSCRIVRPLAPKVVAPGTLMYIEECRGDRPEMGVYRIQLHEDRPSWVYSDTIESGLAPIDFAFQRGEPDRFVIGTMGYRLYDATGIPLKVIAGGANEAATRPAWSPSGLELAFWRGPFGGLPRAGTISALNSRLTSIRVILSDVNHASGLAWSLEGDWIAFSGEYQSEPGVWAYNETDKRIVRVWSAIAPFAWSPVDNERLIVLNQQEGQWTLVESAIPTEQR